MADHVQSADDRVSAEARSPDSEAGGGTHSGHPRPARPSTDGAASTARDSGPSLVEAIADELRGEYRRDCRHLDERAEALRAAARAHEALEEWNRLEAAIDQIDRLDDRREGDRRLERRLRRTDGARGEEIVALLETSAAAATGGERLLFELEAAFTSWHHGAEATSVVDRLAEIEPGELPGESSRWWWAQMKATIDLERGEFGAAAGALDRFLELATTERLRQLAALRLALVEHLRGDPAGAADRLASCKGLVDRVPEVADLYRHHCFAADRADRALDGPGAAEPGEAGDAADALESAALDLRFDSAGRAAERLDAAVEAWPEDRPVLALRHDLVASTADEPGPELVDVLNQRVEQTPGDDRRAIELYRLGRCYETHLDNEAAAADVYREAIESVPDFRAPIRALRAIARRRRNWEEVAELLEREIRATEGTAARRLRFRAAEVREFHLDDAEAALDHYRAVHEEAYHLPSIRGIARQLARLDRWSDLARILLSAVPRAPSPREEARLLRDVARIGAEHLDEDEVRRRALQELLDMDVELAPEFARLGRLHAAAERWDDLIELNRREAEEAQTDRIAAARLVESGRIAERELENLGRAEALYEEALEVDPGCFAARLGLLRTHRQRDRWSEVADVLRETIDRRHDVAGDRRLQLAERLEHRLDRPAEAAETYRNLLARIDGRASHADGPLTTDERHAHRALLDLRRRRGDWGEVEHLLDHAPAEEGSDGAGREGAGRVGRLAVVRECLLDEPGPAHRAYRRALTSDPGSRHWLRGVVRTLRAADADPGDVADFLEDNAVGELDAGVRDAYFRAIARLREHADQSAAVSRAHRMHGSDEHRENEEVARLAMAEAGERKELIQLRRRDPFHPAERLTHLDRSAPREEEAAVLRRAATGPLANTERRLLAGEVPPWAAAPAVTDADPTALRFAAALQVAEREDLEAPAVDSAVESRLRAVRALQAGRDEAAARHLVGELGYRTCRDASIRLLTRAATVCVDSDARWSEAIVRAATSVLVEGVDPPSALPGHLENEELATLDGPVDHSTVDQLILVGTRAEQWRLVVELLTWEASRDSTGYERRLSLLQEAATIREGELGDPDGAAELFERCWNLSEEPDHLAAVVRLALQADDVERAIDRRRRHYRYLCSNRRGPDDDRAAQSGLELARLLRRTDEPTKARELLEEITRRYTTDSTHDPVWRELAYVYLELDRPREAVDAFRTFLDLDVHRSELGDCRTLVQTHAEALDDPKTALRLQWQIVQSFPTDRRELERCLELAARAGMLDAAVSHLEALADDCTGRARSSLLQFAARGADAYLERPEQAVRLYDELLGSELPVEDERRKSLERRRALSLCNIVGRENRAVEEFRSLVRRDPLDRDLLASMRDVFERQQANDRVRLVEQVLGAEADDGARSNRRVKCRPAQSFDPPTIEACLIPDELDPAVFRVLQKSVPLAEKVLGDDLPQRKALEGQPLERHRAAPSRDALDAASSAFDLGEMTAEVGETGPPEPQVFSGRRPYVWLNSALFRDTDHGDFRFLAGYAAALADAELAPVLSLDGRQFWHLIEGVWLRRGEGGFEERVDVQSREFADEISSPFLAMARRRVTRAVEPALDEMAETPCALWPELVEEYACRAGLVLCGDLGAALRCLLRFRDLSMDLTVPQTRRRFSRIDLVGRLLEFAFSRSYLEARYHLGLGGPPDEVGIERRS